LKRLPGYYTLSFFFASCLLILASCQTIDLYEKNVAVPQQAWSSQFKPEFSFEIKDTTSLYKLYIVLRHKDAYHYKNIWVKIETIPPGEAAKSESVDLPLATDSKGWQGTAMDDIIEHRIALNESKPYPLRKGIYRFRLSNIMREDPLENVMNVGIRIEKVK